MTNTTAPTTSKRVAVANKIKQVRTPLIVATAAAAGVYVAVKWEMDSRAVLVWHQQRIEELVETSNQLLEDVRNLQA